MLGLGMFMKAHYTIMPIQTQESQYSTGSNIMAKTKSSCPDFQTLAFHERPDSQPKVHLSRILRHSAAQAKIGAADGVYGQELHKTTETNVTRISQSDQNF